VSNDIRHCARNMPKWLLRWFFTSGFRFIIVCKRLLKRSGKLREFHFPKFVSALVSFSLDLNTERVSQLMTAGGRVPSCRRERRWRIVCLSRTIQLGHINKRMLDNCVDWTAVGDDPERMDISKHTLLIDYQLAWLGRDGRSAARARLRQTTN